MAKAAATKTAAGPKESSQPLVISLVFFVLLSIGLGVFSYTLYSGQADKDAAKAKAEADVKNIRGIADENELLAKGLKAYIGLATPDEAAAVAGLKEGDKVSGELAKLTAAVRAQAGAGSKKAADDLNRALEQYYRDLARKDATPPKLDLAALSPGGFGAWGDETGVRPPAVPLIPAAAQQEVLRNLAAVSATGALAGYNEARLKMAEVAADYDKASKALNDVAKKVPENAQNQIKEVIAQFDKRGETYKSDTTDFRSQLDAKIKEIDALKADLRARDNDLKDLRADLDAALTRVKPADPLEYDEPQGTVTKTLPDRMVEISLGSAAKVTRGLVFTVLPSDFRSKGRQSRMFEYREPDGRGGIRSVQRFTPKATLEVVEVLGPNLSRARLTTEANRTSDRVLEGDLLYNAAWRKGQGDHVALVGIFDLNGDGTDDIATVVTDLTRMGVTVDAWYNLRTLKWEGKLTERTRFVIRGYTPSGATTEATRESRAKIIGGIAAGTNDAKSKAIAVVDFRDFFGRMGYKAANDVSEDRINQAATRYYTGPGAVDAPKSE